MYNHKLNSEETSEIQIETGVWTRVNTWVLRMEGFSLLLICTFLYFHEKGSLWLFLLLLFFPDVSMLGYLIGTKTGTVFYNLMHNIICPLFLVFLSVYIDEPLLTQLALIWLAHIGADRFIGFGLKYPTYFKDTHLHRLGKQ